MTLFSTRSPLEDSVKRNQRIIDVIGASVALVAGSPIGLLGALSVLLFDGRPILYRQRRLGLNGNSFYILKFRTMSPTNCGPSVTRNGDPRITGPGRWLRSSKIDEWPQFVNVIRGEMALVGPRPEVPEFVALWPEQTREIVLSVRPGLTDLATWIYREESALLPKDSDSANTFYAKTLMPRKLHLNEQFIKNGSTLLNLIVLLGTFMSVIGMHSIAGRLQTYVMAQVEAGVEHVDSRIP